MLKSDDYKEYDTVESVNTKRDRRKAGFSSLLNAMDGLGAPEDIIYIFTTNNIDDIDPALIRPGRIDLKLEIGYVTRDQFDQFTMKYFNKVSDEKFDIKDNMSFANIQNEMMKGTSFEDIVDFVRKE
jgi:ATP-dependent 26S proteasome regulatory subunit